MNPSLRRSRLFVFAAFAPLLAGCDSKPKPVSDVLARDSTLALEVFGANQDSAVGFGDTVAQAEGIPSDGPSVTAETDPSQAPSETVAPPVHPAVSKPLPVALEPAPAATQPARIARVEEPTAPVRRNAARARDRSTTRRTREAQAAETRLAARRATIRARQRARATQRTSETRAARQASAARRSSGTNTGTVARGTTGRTSGSTSAITSAGTSRAWMVIPSGSELALASTQSICTNNSAVGDQFNATLSESVAIAGGTVIPNGAVARGEVTSVDPRAGKNGEIAIKIESISFDGRTYPVSSRVTHTDMKRVRTGSRSADAGKVAAGAGVGAILGQVLGRNAKGTIIGAASGAAAGAVIASQTRAYAQCVPDGGRITAELVQPLRVRLSE